MKGLTRRQREILEWIRGFIREHGMPPTVREIGDAFGISSAGVFGHLEALQRKGYVRRGKMGARSLEVACMSEQEGTGESLRLPLVGRVAAGTPVLAVENLEGWVTVGRDMVRPDGSQYFALRVTGDSMEDAGIFEGDCVIVRKQETAEDGDVVVALLDDGEATLKCFYLERKKRRVRLQPANPRWKPIYARDVAIQGVVKGLVRKFV